MAEGFAGDNALVVGIDAGATATKCRVATVRGSVVGRSVAPGANFRSSGADPVDSLTGALTDALSDHRKDRVVAGVIGMAGAASAGIERQRAAAEQAWSAAGLPGSPHVVTDLEVAFASGSAEPDGLLLLAGTGAVAAAVEGFTVVHRRDGYGWLLGDEGSAVWIGLAGLRAAVTGIDGRGEPTALSDTLTRALVGDSLPLAGRPEDLTQAIIGVVYHRPPAELGALAPLVEDAAKAGDAVARRICGEAADRLLTTLDAAHRAASTGSTETVVVAGSVACGSGIVGTLVADGIRDRYGTSPQYAQDGAVGAAALALRDVLADPAADAAHRALIAS